jgi:AcrR family transcriptional regulator
MKTIEGKPRKPARRQEERVALTRKKMLSSAQRIFVRDGFEAAKIEEIASGAAYTIGAFYANYKNKEELFVEVAVQQIEKQASIAWGAVRSETDVKSKIHKLLERMIDAPDARKWAILTTEFSLFVLRHPRRNKHLALLRERLFKDIEEIFEHLYTGIDRTPPVPLPIIGIGFYSLFQGLMLEEKLNGKLVTPRVSSELLKIYLDAVLGIKSKPGA